MDEHAEDPVGQAGQKVVQCASLARMAVEAIAQVHQQRAAATAATDARAVAAARAERTAALTAARPKWQPMLDGRLYGRTSLADAGLAWAAAQGWRQVDPQAALASDRALQRLRELRPDVMERFDRLTGDGLHPVEAMRRVTPFLDRPQARPGEHAARAALSAATASTSAKTAPPPGPEQHADTVPVDTRSSASRQHYIDTGQYLAAGEAAPTGDDDTEPTAVADAVDERAQTTGDLDRSTGVRCGQPLAAGSALEPATLGDAARDSHCRSAADLAKDGFPEPLTAEVLAAGRVRPKAPATTAPAAVRAAGLATAARAASRTR
jgi:hypothetical protein